MTYERLLYLNDIRKALNNVLVKLQYKDQEIFAIYTKSNIEDIRLSEEIIAMIVNYLPVRDMLRLGQSCTHLYKHTQREGIFWVRRIRRFLYEIFARRNWLGKNMYKLLHEAYMDMGNCCLYL